MNRSIVVLLAVILIAADKPKPKEPCQDLIYCEASDDKELKKLVKTLVDSSQPTERIKAANTLREMGPAAEEASAALCKVMASNPSPTVRQAASEALETVNPFLRKHVELMCYDANVNERLPAIKEIRKLGRDGKAAVPALWTRYKTGKLEVREPALLLEALVDLAADDEFLADYWIRMAKNSDQHGLQYLAIRRLPDLTVGSRAAMVDAVRFALRSSKLTSTTITCITALEQLTPESRAVLDDLRKLKGSGAREVRDAATSAIVKIEAAKVVLVAADNPKDNEPCEELIYRPINREIREVIATLLDSKNSADRLAAATTLRKLGANAPSAAFALCKSLAIEQIPDVRDEVTAALKAIDTKLWMCASDIMPIPSYSRSMDERTSRIQEMILQKQAEKVRPIVPLLWHFYMQIDTRGERQRLAGRRTNQYVQSEEKVLFKLLGSLCPDDDVLATHALKVVMAPDGKLPHSRYVTVPFLARLTAGDRKAMVIATRNAMSQASEDGDILACINVLVDFGDDARPAIDDIRKFTTKRYAKIQQQAIIAIDKIERSKPNP